MKGRFGLIGEPLVHSLSPEVHHLLHRIPFHLFHQLTPEAAINDPSIEAFHITAPYKNQAFHLCTEVSDEARLTKAVNLIEKKGNVIRGWNTDVEGMIILLKRLKLSKDVPVKILGNGATSRSMKVACQMYGFINITVHARSPQQDEQHLSSLIASSSLMIQTIPFGTLSVDAVPFTVLKQSVAIIDVNYHPVHTQVIDQAIHDHIPWFNGLGLLVAQAIKGCEHLGLLTKPIHFSEVLSGVWQTIPLWLVGMPGSGKSTLGQRFAKTHHRPFYDLDTILESRLHQPLGDFIRKNGEARFREEEAKLFTPSLLTKGAVIATGGGCVLNMNNRRFMRQHGLVLWLDRDHGFLEDRNRPLTQTITSYRETKKIRTPLYADMSHIHLQVNQKNLEETEQLLEEIYAHYLHVLGT